jgi:hypothetical protein
MGLEYIRTRLPRFTRAVLYVFRRRKIGEATAKSEETLLRPCAIRVMA